MGISGTGTLIQSTKERYLTSDIKYLSISLCYSFLIRIFVELKYNNVFSMKELLIAIFPCIADTVSFQDVIATDNYTTILIEYNDVHT